MVSAGSGTPTNGNGLVERQRGKDVIPDLLHLFDLFSIFIHTQAGLDALETRMTHRLLFQLAEGVDVPWHNDESSIWLFDTNTNTHTLTDSSLPGFRGLKLQEMTMELGLMEALLWNVHFRRTSVPLTASTSPDVYTCIPLTCSTPATHKHMAQQQSLLQKQNAAHTEKINT